MKPPQWIGPLESADLAVECETEGRRDGLLDKLVVHSDDRLVPEFTLEVAARVEPMLAFTSPTVDLRMAFGEEDSQEVRLTGRFAMAAQLAIETVDPPGPEVRVVPCEQGKRSAYA